MRRARAGRDKPRAVVAGPRVCCSENLSRSDDRYAYNLFYSYVNYRSGQHFVFLSWQLHISPHQQDFLRGRSSATNLLIIVF